ncbi:MotA/TolQ/ExbB proton channel family protein [Stieleria varia]|uniref:MotA/TolQ/ExbB proton channel domain-containing protein n=1 Tax=Stieleria varia TaxID=2528005 RepID=A0A5C6B8H9_9BACT|nr:MotA/TolQ/ExbB proton channel family protein [Stieleria varia]TWU07599.1 hypothetical protein Pla52n_01720 [Stieleria varia]
MNEVLKPLLWTALGIESVFALAILLASIESIRGLGRKRASGNELAAKAIAYAERLGGRDCLKDPLDGFRPRAHWLADVRRYCPPLADCLSVLLDTEYGEHREEAVQITLQSHLGGGKNLASFIIRTAALFGLALTFVGIIDALQVFEVDATNIAGLTRGFYTSLTSTILGIIATVITLVGFMSQRRTDGQMAEQVQLAILKLNHWLHHHVACEDPMAVVCEAVETQPNGHANATRDASHRPASVVHQQVGRPQVGRQSVRSQSVRKPVAAPLLNAAAADLTMGDLS